MRIIKKRLNLLLAVLLVVLVTGCNSAPSPSPSPVPVPTATPLPIAGNIHNVTQDTRYTTIQGAVNSAGNGDIIVVQPGTYYEIIDFLGKNITLRSTQPTDPEIVASTIIDGNWRGSVVTFQSGEGSEAILSGFTIQNGEAEYGGGIYIGNASPTVRSNHIIGNTASYGGGVAIQFTSSSPTLQNNVIYNNRALDSGGGIVINSSATPVVINNFIHNNRANYHGGGIYITSGSRPQIRNNRIEDNMAERGGGISITNWSHSIITGNEIYNNMAGNMGGGIFVGFNSGALNAAGTPWPRDWVPPASEPTNTYLGNTVGGLGMIGMDVYFELPGF